MAAKVLTRFLVLGLLGLGPLLASCTSLTYASPKELAQETKGLVEEAKETEKTVFQVLSKNLGTLRELKAQVQGSKDPAKLLDKVIEELEKITQDFERMARREGVIENDLLQKVRSLHRLTDKAREELDQIRIRKAKFERELQAIADPDPTIVEMKRKAYSQTVRYLQKQIEIWERFLQTHQQIEEEVSRIDQRVGRFLTAIELSALVYREGLNTLQLQKDIQQAQALLSEIPEIERLTQEMIMSWDTLDSLINELLSFAT